MWDLPGPGLEPVFPALAGGFLTTAPPGKPQIIVFIVDKQKVSWRHSPFSSHVTTLYTLQCPRSPIHQISHSHGHTNPSEDANGIHSSSQVHNSNPGPQASRARWGYARDKGFVPSFSLSISSSLFWVKTCFILFYWQERRKGAGGQKSERKQRR